MPSQTSSHMYSTDFSYDANYDASWTETDQSQLYHQHNPISNMNDGNTGGGDGTYVVASAGTSSEIQTQYPANYIATLSAEQNVSDFDSLKIHTIPGHVGKSTGLQILLVDSDFKVVWSGPVITTDHLNITSNPIFTRASDTFYERPYIYSSSLTVSLNRNVTDAIVSYNDVGDGITGDNGVVNSGTQSLTSGDYSVVVETTGQVIIQLVNGEVIASGSSLNQSTLDLTLTASDDGLDGNISASDIITTNGSIAAFSQTSPTTWDLTYTSDYSKQSNAGSLFIEQDTIYNNDVSDAFAPPSTFKYVVLYRVAAPNTYSIPNGYNSSTTGIHIKGIYCYLNNGTDVLLDSAGTTAILSTDFTHDGTTATSWTRDTSVEYGPGGRGPEKAIDGSTSDVGVTAGDSNWIATLSSEHKVSDINYIEFQNNRTGTTRWRCAGLKILLLNSDLEIVCSSSVTDTASDMYTFNYSELNLQGGSFTPPSWWTREHNKASNRFEWTALNSGADDNSSTPTRPSLTISSADLDHGGSQSLGIISMSIYVSSSNLSLVESDLSFTNGVVSDFIKSANNYYTFNFTSTIVSQASSVYILQDAVYNRESLTDFNEASNIFEWTWNYSPTAPDVTISSSDVAHNGNYAGQEVNMVLEFSNDVLSGNSVSSSFTISDVSAINGYIFDVSEISQSQIAFKCGSTSIAETTTVFFPQNIISRTFNGVYTVSSNNTSNVFTWNYDSADLTVSSLSVNNAEGSSISTGGYVNNNELWAQFVFSESIYNFKSNYFTTSNCKISNISSNTTFTTFTVKLETFYASSPSIAVKTNKLVTSGRGLQKYVTGASNLSFSWHYDDTRPEISMTSSQESGLTNSVAFVDLSFVSTIGTSNFTENSITVTGDASLSNFTATSDTEYSVRVTPNSASAINVSVNVDAYTEQYGNGNENSVSFDWTYDNVPPTVTISSPDIANGASSSDSYINVYFTITKPVSDFVLSDDANVVNGTLGALTKTDVFDGHDNNFTLTVATKTGSHPYTGSGSSSGYFVDGLESPALDFIVGKTYTFDQSDSTNSGHPLLFYLDDSKTTEYTTNVTSSGTAGTSEATVTITIDENTPSTLFYQCGRHRFMGYKAEVANKESYVAKLYPTQTNETVSVYVLANSITDDAGNTNASDSSTFSWGFNSDDLLATLSSTDIQNNGSFANDAISVSLATSDDIVDFEAADISCENGTISNVDATAKTFTVTSNAQGLPTSFFIIGGAIETAQGEGNIESNLFTWTYNPPIPKLVIKSSQISTGDYTKGFTRLNLHLHLIKRLLYSYKVIWW